MSASPEGPQNQIDAAMEFVRKSPRLSATVRKCAVVVCKGSQVKEDAKTYLQRVVEHTYHVGVDFLKYCKWDGCTHKESDR